MTFLGPIREWHLQGKPTPYNLDRQANPQSHSEDLPLWGRMHWSYTLARTLKGNFHELLEADFVLP